MELTRRHALAGVALALAGCSGVETEVQERAERFGSFRGHPLSGSTTLSIVDESESHHDLERLTREALRYWTANAADYAGFGVSFELTASDSDIELVFLENRNDLRGCREHASQGVLGCAPLLKNGHRPTRPITVEVVVAERPYGDILVTVKHELGHTLGLTHDDEPANIMSNDIEDRLPEYARRTEILDLTEKAWNDRNDAKRVYNRSIERWNDGEYDTASSGFTSAAKAYRAVSPSIAAAADLEAGFEGMIRPETVDREVLRLYFDRMSEWVELGITRSELMAEAASARDTGDVSTARARMSAAEERSETLRTMRFPSPADVARALGLLHSGRTESTADEPDDMSTVLFS